jgi:hypothetical protein
MDPADDFNPIQETMVAQAAFMELAQLRLGLDTLSCLSVVLPKSWSDLDRGFNRP